MPIHFNLSQPKDKLSIPQPPTISSINVSTDEGSGGPVFSTLNWAFPNPCIFLLMPHLYFEELDELVNATKRIFGLFAYSNQIAVVSCMTRGKQDGVKGKKAKLNLAPNCFIRVVFSIIEFV